MAKKIILNTEGQNLTKLQRILHALSPEERERANNIVQLVTEQIEKRRIKDQNPDQDVNPPG